MMTIGAYDSNVRLHSTIPNKFSRAKDVFINLNARELGTAG